MERGTQKNSRPRRGTRGTGGPVVFTQAFDGSSAGGSGGSYDPFEPVSFLPEQASERAKALGESLRRLYTAVLGSGIEDALKGDEEALEWLRSEKDEIESSGYCSFLALCELLGVEAEWVRKRVEAGRARKKRVEWRAQRKGPKARVRGVQRAVVAEVRR